MSKHDTRSLDEALANAKAHADGMDKAMVRLRTAWAAWMAVLPPVGADLGQMLEALLVAVDMAHENFVRWPRPPGVGHDSPEHPYKPGSECYEHWNSACGAREAAVQALIGYARLLRTGGAL